MEIPLLPPPTQFEDDIHVESEEWIEQLLIDYFGDDSCSMIPPNTGDSYINVPSTSTGGMTQPATLEWADRLSPDTLEGLLSELGDSTPRNITIIEQIGGGHEIP